jgi:hypothetical protein
MDIKKPILRGTGTGKKSTAIRRGHDATRALFPSGTGISHGPLGTSFRPTQAAQSASTNARAYYA